MPFGSLLQSWRLFIFSLPLVWLGVIAAAFFSSRAAFASGWWQHPATHASLALSCLLSGALSVRYLYLLARTPVSTIAGAAPGRVELVGEAHPLPGCEPLSSPMQGRKCLGFGYFRLNLQGKSVEVAADEERVVEAFLLKDGTGQCVVETKGAWIRFARGKSRSKGWGVFRPQVEESELIFPVGARVCVLGWMKDTLLDAEQVASRVADALVNDWKRDQPRFLVRFDKNRDRLIAAEEWLAAKAEALRTARRRTRGVGTGVRQVAEPPSGLYYVNCDLRKHPAYWGFMTAALANTAFLAVAAYFLQRFSGNS